MVVEIAKEDSFSAFRGQQIYPDRMAPLLQYSQGKKVLNVGCAGSDALTAINPMHARLSAVSSHCLGIDIFEPGIEKFVANGLHAVVADAEHLDLPDRNFQVAVLGDVIEHVSNPGLVLDNINRHLVDGGIAVVTTPNPFSLTLMLRRLLGKRYTVNSEHVCWFDPVLLSYLMERSGFGNFEVFWTDASQFSLLRALQKRNPGFHATFGLVAQKVRSV